MRTYDTYKDSGISWLGQIPSHWELKTLRNFLIPFSLKGFPELQMLSVTREQGVILRDMERESNHNVIPEDLSGYKVVRRGQFVINKMKSWQGSYGVSKFEGIVSPAYFVYDLNISNKDFFHIALRSRAYIPFFMQFSKGIRVDQWDLSPIALKSIPFVLPTPSEQEAIVAYLDSATAEIDKAIASQQRMVELLQERKQIIINQAVTQGLNPDAPMKPTNIDWLPQIPTHWDIKKLKHVSSLFGRIGFRGYSTSDLTDMEHGAITLSPSNMIDGKMNFDNCSFLSWDKYFESPEIMVKEGDILFVKTGSTYGKSAIVETLPKESTINPQILIITNISIHNKYLYYLLRTPIITNQVETIVIGGTIPTISQTKIGNMSIIIPSISEQKEIVNYIESAVRPIDEAISRCEQKIALLTERKQILINDVVTGKIKVS